MANIGKSTRLAVLIDADNTSWRIADGLFEEIAKLGTATVRRIYGDFRSDLLQSWVEVLPKHAIAPHQQFAHTVQKNSSDIALVIDAMDVLHAGKADGFCLVSSDSDFTRLAMRLREEGVDVYGFGKQNTPESLRQACTRFIYTENLVVEPIVGTELVALPQEDAEPQQFQPIGKAKALIIRAIAEIAGEDGWVHLGTLGSHLSKLASDFDSRNFGYKKLSDLARKIHGIEVRDSEGGRVHARLAGVSYHPPATVQTKKLANVTTMSVPETLT